jgi:hypothetical protein
MITFKSPQDLRKLSPNNPAFPVLKHLVQVLIDAYTWPGHPYPPEDYGYVVLIEEEDADRVLTEIWDDWTLVDIDHQRSSRIHTYPQESQLPHPLRQIQAHLPHRLHH